MHDPVFRCGQIIFFSGHRPSARRVVKVGRGLVDLDSVTRMTSSGRRPRRSQVSQREPPDDPTVTLQVLIVNDTAIDFIPKSTDNTQFGDPIMPGATIQGVAPFNAKRCSSSRPPALCLKLRNRAGASAYRRCWQPRKWPAGGIRDDAEGVQRARSFGARVHPRIEAHQRQPA